MTTNEFENEVNYREAKVILKDMLDKRIITKPEYKELLQDFKEKYEPTFDLLT